ncbi:MAG: T9SS type A sorting domain-containing protein [Bacteroidales bacterium]|nr:T9SS type A sorting domain-containing protein [Candidatus Scybalousia scybalohippi]
MKNKKLLLSLLFFAVMGMMANMTMATPSIVTDGEGEPTGWTSIGPNNVAGRVRAAIFDKNNYGVVYAGTVGGLYISVNNGKNWEELSLGNGVENVTALAQDENGILYVGTGEGYYTVGLHNEDPLGRSNLTTGKVGTGVYKLANSSYTKEWAANFITDEEKYAWAKENITFEHMSSTTVSSRADSFDEWAYINTMAYANGNLYVGTKNGGLKVSQGGQDSFTAVAIEGNTAINIHDIAVNPNGVVAVSYDNAGGSVAVNTLENPTTFTRIFNSDVTQAINENDAYLGRIALTFGTSNPDYLYAYVANQSQSFVSSSEYTQMDINGYAIGIYRTRSLSDVSWNKITPATFSNGSQLGYGISIAVNDADEKEVVYAGGTNLFVGQDVNGTDVFSWTPQTYNTLEDVSGYFVPANMHNVLFMPNPQNEYDSIFMLVSTDAGVYTYKYDTIIGTASWFPGKGMNNLQAYKIAATADGSVLAASQSNAIVYMPSTSDTDLKGGMRIWSINNPGNPMISRYDYDGPSASGSAVETSAIYRTLPTNTVRKPIIVSRPFTNVSRTYGNSGDFSAIDDQTWTYGGGGEANQALLNGFTVANRAYAQFQTPMAFWETFDAAANTLDSVALTLSDVTVVMRNGEKIKTIAGQEIMIGDSIIVPSDNLSYPFWYVFSEADRDVANFPTGDALFMRWDETVDTTIMVPQKVQSKTLLATESGVFVCGKMLDYKRTYTSGLTDLSLLKKNLTWARIYSTNNQSTNFNRRVRNVALSADGASAFISVDYYSGYSSYDSTIFVRIDGLNTHDISNGTGRSNGGYDGSVAEVADFTSTTLAKYTRQISSIAINPNNANEVVLTFDGYSLGNNVMYSANAMDDNATFTALTAPDENEGSFAPVYTALFEATEGNALYLGTDNGIYKTDNYTASSVVWTKEENIPSVAVYDMWQQTKNLPEVTFHTYTGSTIETSRFAATSNAGVIYAATYGKGLLMNKEYAQENPESIDVSLVDVRNANDLTSLSVYPNPAVDNTTISYTLDNATTVVFNMYDINGRLISTQDNGREARGAHTQMLDIRGMNAGVYMIQMVTDSATRTAKLIVK